MMGYAVAIPQTFAPYLRLSSLALSPIRSPSRNEMSNDREIITNEQGDSQDIKQHKL
jgi:hypothetical protein